MVLLHYQTNSPLACWSSGSDVSRFRLSAARLRNHEVRVMIFVDTFGIGGQYYTVVSDMINMVA